MRIISTKENGNLSIFLEGELDHHAAKGAISRIANLIDVELPLNVTLNLKGLSFMDSSGVAVILRIHKRMLVLGGRLAVIDPAPQPLRVLDASGVDRLVRVVSTAKESVV